MCVCVFTQWYCIFLRFHFAPVRVYADWAYIATVPLSTLKHMQQSINSACTIWSISSAGTHPTECSTEQLIMRWKHKAASFETTRGLKVVKVQCLESFLPLKCKNTAACTSHTLFHKQLSINPALEIIQMLLLPFGSGSPCTTCLFMAMQSISF